MVESITNRVSTPKATGERQDTVTISELTQRLLTILGEHETAGTEEGGVVGGKPELPAPSSDALDVAEMLATIKNKINEAMTGIVRENIEKNRSDQLQKFQERIEQLKKAQEAMKNAEKWGSLGKVFGWLAPALMVAVGAVLVATGIGAPLGAALIAGGLVGLAAQTLEATGAAKWIQEHLLTPLFEAMGMDREKAQMAAFITYQVIIVAIMIAASCGAGSAVSVAGASASTAAGAASSAGTAAASAATTTASTSAQTATKVAVGVTQALLGVGQAGIGLGKAVNEKETAGHEAKALEINALLKKLQQKLEEQEEQLKEIMESWQQGMDIVMNVIDTQANMAKMAMQV